MLRLLILFIFSLFIANADRPKIVDLGGGKFSLESYYEIVSQNEYKTGHDSLNSKVEGFVLSGKYKTKVEYCSISIDNKNRFAKVDSLGYFEGLLPEGYYRFRFTSVQGSDLTTKPIYLKKNTITKLNIELGTSWIQCK